MNKRIDRVVGLAVALVVLASPLGCMNVQRVHQPPATIKEAIRSGELVQPGDRIAVVTASMGEHTLVVASVDQDTIRGDGVEVPIGEILTLEKRELSVGKTALATVGIIAVAPVAVFMVLLLAG